MDKLIKLLHEGNYSCVIKGIRKSALLHSVRGITDLYDLLNTDPAFLRGAQIADKVIGKAAAVLMVLGRVQEVYTDIISEPALVLLPACEYKARLYAGSSSYSE